MTEPWMGLRVKVLAALVLAMFATPTTRLWFLQVLAAEQYKAEAKDNAVRLIEVPAPRGVIKDVNGTLLGRTAGAHHHDQPAGTGARPSAFSSTCPSSSTSRRTSSGRGLDDPRYYVFSPIPVAIDVQQRVAYYIEEHAQDFPASTRFRTGAQIPWAAGAHVLGYLGQISEDKLKDPGSPTTLGRDRCLGDRRHLRALPPARVALKYRVNSTGENLGLIGRQRPVAGDDVGPR